MNSPHDLPTAAPDTVHLDPAWLAHADHCIITSRPDVTSLLVARHGRLVHERYFGLQPHTPQDTQSVTKSLIALLTGIAAQRGLLHPTQRIADLWPDAARAVSDPRWKQVTVDHLLTMTSGLPSELHDPAYDDAWFLNPDPVRFTLAQRLQTTPGATFHYANAGVHLLGALLAHVTGQALHTFAQRALLTPLGIPYRPWPTDPQGRAWGSGMLHLTPREMLRVGQLVLQRGRWQDATVVPTAWIHDMTRPHVNGDAAMEGLPRYGRLWWLPGEHEPAGVYATGFGGQYIAVFPSLELVIVMTGRVSGHASHRHVITGLAAQLTR